MIMISAKCSLYIHVKRVALLQIHIITLTCAVRTVARMC